MTTPRFMSIVAHPDDDLIFLNPDIQKTIAAGHPSLTVVTTASEANGTNNRTREQYAGDQQIGQRKAYALFAGVANQWSRSEHLFGDMTIEVVTLIGAPHVQLAYLNIPDGNDTLYANAIKKLWTNTTYVSPTIVPEGGLVGDVLYYVKQDVLIVLGGLMDMFAPTTVRLQNTDRDPRFAGEHEDHIHTALFGAEVAKTYANKNGWKPVNVIHYVDYNSTDWAVNVAGDWYTKKHQGMDLFRSYDPLVDPEIPTNEQRVIHRWPTGDGWAVVDGAGRLHAFAAMAGGLVRWTRTAGVWAAPTLLATGRFATGVSAAVNKDGLVRIAALNLDTHTIQTWRQQTNGTFGGMQDLSTPKAPQMGAPTVVANLTGGFEIIIRNPATAGGLSTRFQSAIGGTFSAWTAIAGGGTKIIDPPRAIATSDYRIEVFAEVNNQLKRWRQTVPDGSFTYDSAFALQTIGPPAVVETATGIEIVTRRHNGTAVGENVLGATQNALPLQGTGPVAVARTGSRVVVFARGDVQTVAFRQLGANSWGDLGEWVEQGLAAVTDAAGDVHLLALGGNAKLLHAVQPAAGGAFSGWTEA
ncbi:hypothetical protein [Actinosynnema sp. NPDC020468]|uniref:hypothetical protein n=1 Tax=Actinosynnema sp. NPDC020468 TaxID=3154488 RepID=UPI0033DCAB6C